MDLFDKVKSLHEAMPAELFNDESVYKSALNKVPTRALFI
jgi:hypothetical protein